MHKFRRDRNNTDEDRLTAAATLLEEASYTVALTGAGISRPSGIPDFRSPESGLWESYDPMEVASIYSFRRDPARFFDWVRPLIETTQAADPNPAHGALTTLQQHGYLHEIITQNIDGLHEAAGSEKVLPVHGHTRTATCIQCGRDTSAEPLWDVVIAGDIPTCTACGGVLKPDVVFFGELLPEEIFDAAQRAAERSDLVLVAGSSLEVTPAADLPFASLNRGGKLLIVNKGPTQLDRYATVKIDGDVASILPALVERIRFR